MFETESQSYYEILDVKPDASQNDIRQAYLRVKAAYSKDSAALYSLFDDLETRQILETIEQAYLVLSNSEKRKEYDKVHGFLKANEGLPSGPAKNPNRSAHVFSFASGTAAKEDKNPAETVAKSMFGADAVNGNIENASGGGENPANNNTTPTNTNYRVSESHHEDYSTPRTLAAATATNSSTQDYSSDSNSSFNGRENRLGIIRRTDLIKPYAKQPEMEEAITNEAEFRGGFFKKVREYKEITVDELCEFTKISKAYINCIEAEEFESLPAPAYLRGFILQIARALKLPHEKAATAYMANYRNAVMK